MGNLFHLATLAEPLYRLTRKGYSWRWTSEEQGAFQKLKEVLISDQILVHYGQTKPLGLSCDAPDIEIGAVLWHKFQKGSDRPIANASKTLSTTQKGYSQIHKEALSTIFGLHKFYQYLYGQHFTLVTDHKALTAIFGQLHHYLQPIASQGGLSESVVYTQRCTQSPTCW